MAVTTKKRTPAQKRKTAPAYDTSPWIAWGGLLVGAALHVVHLPGGIIWWAALVIAAFQTRRPELTGKGSMGEPVPSTPYEEKLLRRYRARASSRRKIFALSRDWLPRWPLPLGWLIAIVAAATVAELPVLSPIPSAFRVAEFVAVALAMLTQASMWRAQRSEAVDPIPQPSLADAAVTLFRGPARADGPGVGPLGWPVIYRVFWVLAAAAGVGAGLLAWSLAHALFPVVATVPFFGFVASSPPEPQSSTIPLWMALGLISMLWALVASDARSAWRDRVAARAAWKTRFEAKAPKLATPDLIGHETVADVVQIDTFHVPATQSRSDYVRLCDSLKETLGSTTDLFILPVLEDDGADGKAESRTQMRLVTWPDEARPDLTDGSCDDDVVALFAECAMSVATDGEGVPSLAELTRITTSDSEGPAWTSDWAGGVPIETLRASVGRISRALGVQALIDDRAGWMAFGALLEDSTEFDESATGQDSDSMHGIFQDVADSDWWERVWTATMKGKEQQTPTYFASQAEILELPDGSEVRYAAFVTRQGLEPELYYGREQALSTAIEDAPFVSIQPFPNAKASTPDRAARHTQAIGVVWAKPATTTGAPNRVPTTPQAVSPDPEQRSRRAGRSAQQVILAALVAAAFRTAKLPVPLVTKVRPISSPRARMHVWQVNLQLEASPFADVQKKLPAIRQALGCPWLRIEASREGAYLYAGAVPSPSVVTDKKLWQKTIDLDWAATWILAKIVGSDGATPDLVEAEALPGNTDVVRAVFELPPTLSVERIRGGKSKLRAARGLAFLEFAATKDAPTQLTILFSEKDPVPFPAPTDWDALTEPSVPYALAFGVGYDGVPREFVVDRDISLMILGMAGSGKSSTIQTVIAAALTQKYLVSVIDPQKGGVDFAFANDWLIAPIAATVEDALATLKALYAEVEQRKELHKQHSVGHWSELPDDVRREPILLVLDEFTSLVLTDTAPAASKDPASQRARAEVEAKNATRAAIGGMTGRFLREARSVGVATLIGTQKLDAKTLASIPNASDAKSNASRMILGNPALGDLQSALKRPYDVPDVGDDVPKGRGRFEPGTGATELFQSYYATQAELREFLEDEEAPMPPPERLLDVAAFRPETIVADAEEDEESGLLIYARPPAANDDEEVEELDFSDLGVELDDLLDPEAEDGTEEDVTPDEGDGGPFEVADTATEEVSAVEPPSADAEDSPVAVPERHDDEPETIDFSLEDVAAPASNPFAETPPDVEEASPDGVGAGNPFTDAPAAPAVPSTRGAFDQANPFA